MQSHALARPLLHALHGGLVLFLALLLPALASEPAHLEDGKVAVRIGVSHGCEVMRGTFTQIGVYLPPPAGLTGALADADRAGALMEDVAK